MKTQNNKTLKYLAIAVTTIIAGFVSVNAGATENPGTDNKAQVVYQSSSANHSIYGYASNVLAVVSPKPELIYVSQANGPAIHSYAHPGTEKTVSWNVEYVDTAYGPAIYSYERPDKPVHVLRLTAN